MQFLFIKTLSFNNRIKEFLCISNYIVFTALIFTLLFNTFILAVEAAIAVPFLPLTYIFQCLRLFFVSRMLHMQAEQHTLLPLSAVQTIWMKFDEQPPAELLAKLRPDFFSAGVAVSDTLSSGLKSS